MGNDRNIGGTRFGRVATPRPGEAIRLDDRVIGSNPRKQNLTEASGTSPSKLGTKALSGAPKTPTMANAGGSSSGRSAGGMTQDTAPYKHDAFAVGGPGFPKPWR